MFGRSIARFRVTPGRAVDLRKLPTDWTGTAEAARLGRKEIDERARDFLDETRKRLADAQERLYAADAHSVLIIFQALDAAGKDGTIRHVMSGVDPAGCQVFSWKRPSEEELDHDFLWRYAKGLPERGRIGIFNRSYYEEVLVVRIHPEILARQRIPNAKPGPRLWKERYEDINAFERHLVRNGTVVLKFFLHISKAEQKRRFLDRLNHPEKLWKFSAADVDERARWNEYRRAFEEAFSATSTAWAPWWVIPADRKPVARALVAEIIAKAIENLALRFPKPTAEQRKALAAAGKRLKNERG